MDELVQRAGGMSRRDLLAGTLGATAGALVARRIDPGPRIAPATDPTDRKPRLDVPFFGVHQSGITTPRQASVVLSAYDLTVVDLSSVQRLLADWSRLAAHLMAEQWDPASEIISSTILDGPPDSRLTITVAYGPSFFARTEGGARLRPAALVELPDFPGDAIDVQASGGDLLIQACADEPQVARDAIRCFDVLAASRASTRWTNFGSVRETETGAAAPRNQFGFHDGIVDGTGMDEAGLNENVWIDAAAGQAWLAGGTYIVVRKLRMDIGHWDVESVGEQERIIGRAKQSSARLAAGGENHTAGSVSSTPHSYAMRARLNDGVRILRRGYSYNYGTSVAGGLADSGALFLSFQKDPAQFVALQNRFSTADALARYATACASGIFVCPPAPRAGEPWGAHLT